MRQMYASQEALLEKTGAVDLAKKKFLSTHFSLRSYKWNVAQAAETDKKFLEGPIYDYCMHILKKIYVSTASP